MRSVIRRMDQLEATINSYSFQPDILVIAETWMYKNEEKFFNIDNYTAFHCPARNHSTETRGDGCSVFVRNIPSINASLSEKIYIGHTTIIIIKLTNLNIHIAAVYRPPQESAQELFQQMAHIMTKYKRLIWTGDFNINLLDRTNTDVIEYTNTIQSHGFVILNNISLAYATRVSNTVSTIIDHIITDITDRQFNLHTIDCSLSDHRVLMLILPANKRITTTAQVNPFTTIDHESIVNSQAWTSIRNASSFDNLIPLIQQAISQNTETRTRKPDKRNKPWINSEALNMIKQRERFYRLSKRYPEHTRFRENLRELKCSIRARIATAKKQYYNSQIATSAHKPKQLWTHIRSLVFNTAKQLHDTIPTSINIRQQCDEFNQHFISVASTITSNNTQPTQQYLNTVNYAIRSYIPIPPSCEASVLNDIKNLKSNCASGHDQISTRFIKRHATDLASAISRAINDCLQNGIYPDILKKAFVTPVFKSGDKTVANNYRPISVLSAINSLFEEHIKKWFQCFLDTNNFINRNQYGFVRNSSTLAAAANMTHFIRTNLDRRKKVAVIFIDLSKAFDTVSRDILCAKLSKLGLKQREHAIMTSYLENRKQAVKINNTIGTSMNTTRGVPQGAKAASELFIFCVNDIFNHRFEGTLQLFADDMALMYATDSNEQLHQLMQTDLDVLLPWINNNHLKINATKSKFILFSKRNTTSQIPPILIDGQQIERVKNYDYLGLRIDENLRWVDHINKITNSITPYVFALSRIRHFIDEKTATMIYNSYIYTHLMYMAPIWSTAPQYMLDKIRVLQNRSIKIIRKFPPLTRSISLYDDTFLCLNNILSLQINCFTHKVITGNTKNNFNFQTVAEIHTHNTRQRSNYNYYIDYARSTHGSSDILLIGLTQFNNLPVLIKQETNFGKFKRLVKSHLANN